MKFSRSSATVSRRTLRDWHVCEGAGLARTCGLSASTILMAEALHVRSALKRDGTWIIVEPFAHDAVEANLNPVGRLYYSASTMLCVPASMSQEVGAAQAGDARIRDLVMSGGFAHFRRAAETPLNLVFEAGPELRTGFPNTMHKGARIVPGIRHQMGR